MYQVDLSECSNVVEHISILYNCQKEIFWALLVDNFNFNILIQLNFSGYLYVMRNVTYMVFERGKI